MEVEGYKYRLTLNGALHRREGWTGSEYYERVVEYRWWQGEGVLTYADPPPDHIPLCFLFTAPEGENGSLEEGVFSIIEKGWTNHLDLASRLVIERLPEIIDLLCERVECSFQEQVGTCVPRITFSPTRVEELIALGLAYDRDNQLHLAA